MTERTINLKDREPLPQEKPRREKTTAAPPAKPQGEPKKHLLQWSALEYAARERGPYWFLPPSAVALAFVIFGILIRSWFFAAFVALALFVVLLYAKRPPREYRFTIAKEGVYIGETLHRFSELKSFWIIETVEPPELSLETTRRLRPYLHIPLGDMHPNRIKNALSDFLPEEKHKEFFTDQIARSIGF
mgnify:FL=1